MKSMLERDGVANSLQIISNGESALVAQFVVNPTLAAFDGHFPQNPILPAATIMDLSLEIARHVGFFPTARLAQIKGAKFLEPVRPGARVEISFRRDDLATGKIFVGWKIYSEANQAWVRGADFDFSAMSSPTSL